MKRLLYPILMCFMFAGLASAQENRELSIEEAIDTALRQNLTVRQSMVLVKKAEADVRSNRGEFDPSVKLEYYRTYSKEATFTPLISPEEETRMYGVSIGGKAKTGTQYELKYSNTKVEQSEDTLFLEENPYYSTELELTLRQPILKGLGPAVQTARISSSARTFESARIQASEQAAEVIMLTSEAYWDLYAARRNLEVAERSVDLSRKLLEEVRNKIEAGAMPQVELYNAEAEEAVREERLLGAQKGVRDAEDLLRAHMDTKDWETELLPVSEPSVPEAQEPDFDRIMQLAMQNRWDYLKAEKELEASEIMRNFYKNQKLPDLDVVAGAGVSGLGGEQSEARSEAESGDFYSWRVGVELSVPLWNRTAKGNYTRAQRDTETARLRVEEARKTMVIEIREALRALALARKNVKATRKTKVSMEKRLMAAQERFRLGMTTLNDLLSFEEDFAEASSGEIRALSGYAKAAVRLKRVSGTLGQEL